MVIFINKTDGNDFAAYAWDRGGILWHSRFLFVIHVVLCWSTKSVKPSQAIQFNKKLFNTFGYSGGIQWRGGERANYLSFCLRKLVFCESGAEECQTITQDHSQCQESQAKQHQNETKQKTATTNLNFKRFGGRKLWMGNHARCSWTRCWYEYPDWGK